MSMNNIEISTSALLDLTEIIDKMEIKDQLFNIDQKTNKEVAIEVLKLLVTNLYKAKDQVYRFIVNYKKLMKPVEIPNAENMSANEYQEKYQKQYFINEQEALEEAKKFNIVSIFSDLLKIEGVSDFLV